MCMIDDSDGYAVLLHSREQRARIQHRCGECGRTINTGETYLAERTVFDGSAESHKTCAHCKVARDWLQEHCRGFLWNGVAEDILSHESYAWGTAGEPDNTKANRELRVLTDGIKNQWRRGDGRLRPIPQR